MKRLAAWMAPNGRNAFWARFQAAGSPAGADRSAGDRAAWWTRPFPPGDQGAAVRCALLLAALALLGLIASVTAQFFAARAAIGFSSRLRRELFAHIQTLSWRDQDQQGSATLVTRLTGDINQLQTGVNLGLRLLLRSPFVVFGAMIMAFTIDGAAL